MILILILSSAWLFGSALIDFVVVPTAFRNLSNFFEAGNLGILLFSKFNHVEVLFGILIFGSFLHLWKKGQKEKIGLISSIVLFLLSLTYFFYLTPKITTLTELWKTAEANGSLGAPGIQDIQSTHQFYHKLYVTLDTFKLLLLAGLVTLGSRRLK